MKKIVSLTLISSFVLAYEGCGINKKEALNALSQSIYVNVNNKFIKNEKITKGLTTFFSQEIENQSSQTSHVVLKNVKFINKHNQVCAEISKSDVENAAKQTLTYLKNFNIKQLPKDFTQKYKMANSLLSKIEFVESTLNISSKDIKILNNLQKQLNDILNKGDVVFVTNVSNPQIQISSKSNFYTSSEDILLPEGKYSYTIFADGYETQNGVFEVKKGKKIVIKKDLVSLADMNLLNDKISFFSNSSQINISYGYAYSSEDKWDKEKRIEVRYLKNLGIYKVGVGLLTGTPTKWTAADMNELELVASFRVQFPSEKLAISTLPIIPYFGFDTGGDFYDVIDNANNSKTVKLKDVSFIFRGVLGTNILFTKQFGINIQYAHDVAEKNDNVVSGGFIFGF